MDVVRDAGRRHGAGVDLAFGEVGDHVAFERVRHRVQAALVEQLARQRVDHHADAAGPARCPESAAPHRCRGRSASATPLFWYGFVSRIGPRCASGSAMVSSSMSQSTRLARMRGMIQSTCSAGRARRRARVRSRSGNPAPRACRWRAAGRRGSRTSRSRRAPALPPAFAPRRAPRSQCHGSSARSEGADHSDGAGFHFVAPSGLELADVLHDRLDLLVA